jgi:hypothetical protein
MVGLKKTCRKLGIGFWDYLLSRLRGDQSTASPAELSQHKANDWYLHCGDVFLDVPAFLSAHRPRLQDLRVRELAEFEATAQ